MLLVTFSIYRTSLLAKFYQKYLSDIKQGVYLIAMNLVLLMKFCVCECPPMNVVRETDVSSV